MGLGGMATRAQAKDGSVASPALADVPKKYHRAIELAQKDMTGKRWEYFVDPFPVHLRRWLASLLVDQRDYPMLMVMFNILCFTGAAIFLQTQLTPWSTAAHVVGVVYQVGQLVLVDARYFLCLHYAQHLKLFNPARVTQAGAALLNELLPTVFAPFFGVPPGMYFLHHVVMHHVEDNGFPADLTSTMPYQRDSFLEFFKYWVTYFMSAVYLPIYAVAKGRSRLALYSVTLMGCYVACLRFAWSLHPTAALYTLVVPLARASFFLMLGNFSQHIFVEPSRPMDDYVSTYNCLGVLDNRFTFNDGYHIVHHLNARKHWSEMPQHFIDNLPKYEEHEALLFGGLFFFEVGVLVFLGQWKRLARHVVQLRDEPLSEAEMVALLKRRVRRIDCFGQSVAARQQRPSPVAAAAYASSKDQ